MPLILSAILLGISLCADCFAVSLCSSVGLDRARIRERVGKVAAVFAVVQTGFFLAGWAVGMGFEEKGLKCTVTAMDRRRVMRMRIERLHEAEPESEPEDKEENKDDQD